MSPTTSPTQSPTMSPTASAPPALPHRRARTPASQPGLPPRRGPERRFDDDAEHVRALEAEVAQLRTAMASRAVIEQAKGVLMLLTGCGDEGSFELLTHISSHTHRKVRDVAADLVGSAAGRGGLPADVRAILRDACPPPRRTR